MYKYVKYKFCLLFPKLDLIQFYSSILKIMFEIQLYYLDIV